MEKTENDIFNLLINLKEKYCATGVKAEFETEGASFDEALRLKNIVEKAGLEFTLKIGGCEAVKDMYEAKEIGVDVLVAPMIESSYAMQKFVMAIKRVFSSEERANIKFYINLETITGINNFEEIIASEYFSDIDGIVLGRGDLVASMGLPKDRVDCESVFEMTNRVGQKMKDMGKEFVVGGNVTSNSVQFFKMLPESTMTAFETRKIVFDAERILKSENIDESIIKALEFEMLWIRSKSEITEADSVRLCSLEKRCDEIKNAVILYN